MVIAVIAGRTFPVERALDWLSSEGKRLIGKKNIWRVGATPGAEFEFMYQLLTKGERVEVHLPATVDLYYPAENRELLKLMKRKGQVEEYRLKDFPYGSSWQKRNSGMLRDASMLVVFPDKKDREVIKRTANEAQRKKKKLIVIQSQ